MGTLGKKIAKLIIKDVDNDQCVVPAAEGVVDYFRPPVDCNLCKDVTGLTVVENITPEEFHKKFAFTMKPLLVKGGQKHWNAKNILAWITLDLFILKNLKRFGEYKVTANSFRIKLI